MLSKNLSVLITLASVIMVHSRSWLAIIHHTREVEDSPKKEAEVSKFSSLCYWDEKQGDGY